MAEINSSRFLKFSVQTRHIIYVLVLLFIPSSLLSQDKNVPASGKRKIELLHADFSKANARLGKDLSRFLGNVQFKHNDILMSCDSAYYYKNSNQLKAFSNVHVEQGDTLDMFGDYLFYDGTEEKALVTGNVELINNDIHLYTDVVNYDVKTKTAYYPNRGRITNVENVLTSLMGVYYISQKRFHFKDSVKIVNPDYVMVADTMEYDTDTETSFFFGPTNLDGDSIHIYCERGWYDTKNSISTLWKNALLDNLQQTINADSLYYEELTGFGRATGNVTIADTTNKIQIKGHKATYYKSPEKILVTDRAIFVQFSNNDTLYLHADTIRANTIEDITGKSYRLMRAYYAARIFSNQMQARCDSLSYSFKDSVVRLYESPIVWAQENQLTSDSIALFTKNSKMDRMELYNAALVVSEVDSSRYNQTKGRNLVGYFKNNDLFKIRIDGNGETIYFLPDGEDIIGVRQAKSASLEIFLEDGELKDIYEYQNPEGTLDPPLAAPPASLRLTGFKWFDDLRPKKMEDIFLDK